MGFQPEVHLVHSGKERIFQDRGMMTVLSVHEKLQEHHIHVLGNKRAVHATSQAVELSDGKTISYDYLVWATGAAAPPVLKQTGLTLGKNGLLSCLNVKLN
jgi:NADH dehydrogenase FAD-containing subunit